MRNLVSEVYDMVEKQANDIDRLNLLRNEAHKNMVVGHLLNYNFNPNIKFLLPEGKPPFNNEGKPAGMESTTLEKEFRRFYIWLDANQNLPTMRREQLFIEMLSGLNIDEANLICLVKDKKLQERYPSITLKLVQETFPDLLPPGIIEEPKKKKGRPKKEK
jgi:hypothetical protein